jgi:thiosulfate dehydrogenase (quinone) large subunit
VAKLAYAIFRLTLGVDIFLHGATRIATGVGAFASKTGAMFSGTPLPVPFTSAFLIVLPFVEAAVGLALILGFLTRVALVVGALLMAVLVFGTALRSDWNTVGLQMIYVIAYYLLLSRVSDDVYSLDYLFNARRHRVP